jgi:lysophospholipase L1-like esterase
VPTGAPVNSPPYEQNLGGMPVGNHTIRAIVTDASGWMSNSLVHTVLITGPLAASLTPTNGLVFDLGTSLSLTAVVAGGESPYAANFYVNKQLAGSVSAAPFRLDLGTLPAGSYTCYVHATDSSVPVQDAFSSTNRITILPRLRVMPLGDSITYGLGAGGGYRAPLYQLITNAGYILDYIGNQIGNGAASLPDPDHEGYSGATIASIDSILPSIFNASAPPHIILLLLGVNDFRGPPDTAHATNRLEALVVRLATNWPNAKIIVGSLTEVYEPINTQIQTNFNPFLPGMCERQRGLGRQVYFTDMHSAVPLADMPDQLHPNQLGYTKMATNWFNVVNIMATPTLDFDGDGMSNLDEYLSGTDPTNPGSVLKLTLATTNSALLEFVARSNIAYSIQFRTNLVTGSWNNLTNLNAQSQTRTVQVNAVSSPSLPEYYYRVVTPQVP